MATKEIYQAQCGACGYVLGEVAEANAAIAAKCGKCGAEKMGVKKATVSERTSLDYNVFVSCKQTNNTLKSGFTIQADELINMSPVEIKNAFVERCAQALIGVFDRGNVEKMIKEVE